MVVKVCRGPPSRGGGGAEGRGRPGPEEVVADLPGLEGAGEEELREVTVPHGRRPLVPQRLDYWGGAGQGNG